jgi:flagellar basal body rod protein FlgG
MAYAGLRSRAQALEVVTNNIANLRSAGFKKQTVHFKVRENRAGEEFSPLAEAINGPVVEAFARTDFSMGELKQTGNPLNLALTGDGFFVIDTSRGLRYTRDGSFQVNRARELITVDGFHVVPEGWTPEKPKRIKLPEGAVEISENGQVSADGVIVAKLKLVSFQDPSKLERIGGSLFDAPQSAKETKPPATTRVAQGFTEQANLNPIESITTVLEVMRSYEMLTRTIRSLTRDIDQKVINEVGRV